jgi:hypothetical protein
MTEALRHYTGKWLAISPEQAVLSVFVPKALRLRTEAWAALHFELFECIFALEHEPVRLQKSQWWAEELQRLQNQTPRHPVTQALIDSDAPFAAMAGPLLALAAQVPINSSNTLALMACLKPLAQAVDACETVLFQGKTSDNSPAITASWLSLRMPHGLAGFDRAMLPMHLRARHGAAASDADHAALKRDWSVIGIVKRNAVSPGDVCRLCNPMHCLPSGPVMLGIPGARCACTNHRPYSTRHCRLSPARKGCRN